MPSENSLSSDALFRAVFEHASAGIAVLDLDGHVLRANAELERILGYAADELTGLYFTEATHPDDRDEDVLLFQELVDGERDAYSVEKRCIRKDGGVVWVRLRVSLLPQSGQRMMLAIIEDVTERRGMQQQLEVERAHLDQLFESAPVGIVLVDFQDRILRVNGAFCKLFGFSRDEVLGRTIDDLIVPKDSSEKSLAITRRIAEGDEHMVQTVRQRKDGTAVHVVVLGTPVRLRGEILGVYGIYYDVTERVEAESALERLTITDELTGLFNRRGFFNLAERELQIARRNKRDLLLLYIDLDNFKMINDTYGHAEGDEVLVEVGEMLTRIYRGTDVVGRLHPDLTAARGVLARMGGDEFVVMALNADSGGAEVLTQRLYAGLEEMNRRRNRPYDISLSVGIVRTPATNVESLDGLLSEADSLMYQQKQATEMTGEESV